MREARHERLGERGVRAHCLHYGRLGIDPDPGWRGGDCVAVVILGKEGGFGKELTPARGMENHQVIIGGAPDEPQPAAFDLVDCPSPVALLEKDIARGKLADDAPGIE